MTENNEESLKDLSSPWLVNIAKQLSQLEFHERLMQEGTSNLEDYILSLGVNVHQKQIPQIQLKNMKLMITETEMLLNNIRAILEKETYDKLKSRLKLFNSYCVCETDKESGVFRIIKTIDKKFPRHIILTKSFYITSKGLAELRNELITNIQHLLWTIETKNKANKREV